MTISRGSPPASILRLKIADVDIDDIGLRQEFVVPDVLKQHRPGDDLVRPAHEIFEQLEFARQQFDAAFVAPHGAIDEVHFQRSGAQAGGARVDETSRQRFDPRGELAQLERLDQIVIAARLQAADTIVDTKRAR